MFLSKQAMVGINVVGGVAVLASYAYCLVTHPLPSEFWGGVPQGLRPVYTVNMFLAAAGYLVFTYFLMFRLPIVSEHGAWSGVGTFNMLYVLILLPSALWMPLTLEMLSSPSVGLWWIIRLTLIAVGVGSVGMLMGLVAVRRRSPSLPHMLAVAGSVPFCIQTAILDALVWPAYFSA